MKASTDNAHIRTEARQEKSGLQAEEAQRLLNDPAFIRGFEAVREGVFNEITNLKHDGQPQTDDYERELCRTLRTINSLKRVLSLGVQGRKLRLAEFQASTPEQVEDKD